MLKIDFELTPGFASPNPGFTASNEFLGKIATIQRLEEAWTVYPYCFPIYERFGRFKEDDGFVSLEAAKLFCEVIAHEMVALNKIPAKK